MLGTHPKERFMLTAEDIKTAVGSFPKKEYLILRNWFSERDRKLRNKENGMSSATGELSAKFCELKKKWERDTLFLSSTSEICMHPAYQGIIGMGPAVLPLIMKDMAEKPALWFWALKAVTGEDPVPECKRGKIYEMTEIWLGWWSDNKHKYGIL